MKGKSVNSQKKMKQMKRMTAAVMTGLLLFSNTALAEISPPFARTEEEWARLRDNVLEWDEIAALVHEYNPTVTSNWIQYNHDEARGLNSDEYAQKLREQAQQNYDDAVSAAQTDAEIAAADMARKQMEAQADAATIDGEIVKMTYEQAEAGIVLQVKQDMLAWYTAQLTQQSDDIACRQAQSQYDAAVRKQSVGQATALEVMTAEENLKNAQARLVTDEASVTKAKQKLLISLGWQYNDTPEICAVPLVTDEALDAINLEQDVAKAQETNYSLRINGRKLNNAREDSTKRQLETSIKNGREQVKSDVTGKYNAVSDARAKKAQQALNISKLQSSYDTAKRNFDLGAVSARELESAQYALEAAQLAQKQAEYELTLAWITYQAAVYEGLASAGA